MLHKYASCFLTRYAVNDENYTPWIITHDDDNQLDPEVINNLLERFIATYYSDTDRAEDDPDILDTFYGYLGSLGYGIYTMPIFGHTILEEIK